MQGPDEFGMFLQRLMSSFAYQLPFLIVAIGGIVYALMNREKSPSASSFLVISLIVLVILALVRPIGNELIFMALRKNPGGAMSGVHQLWGVLMTLVDAAATAGIIYAVFCDRDAAPGKAAGGFGGALPQQNPYYQPPGPPPGGFPGSR